MKMELLDGITASHKHRAAADHDQDKEAFYAAYPTFKQPSRWFVIIGGKAYHTRIIMAAAYSFVHPIAKRLTSTDLNAGATIARKFTELRFPWKSLDELGNVPIA